MSWDHYYEHNLYNRGKDHGKIGGEEWWRGPFQFQGHFCQRRFVPDAKGKPVLLIRNHIPHIKSSFQHIFADKTKVGIAIFYVPDLGVFSEFEDDHCNVTDLHERMKYIMLMQTRKFVKEDTQHYTGQQLSNKARWEQTPKVEVLRKTLNDFYARWTSYSTLFGLGWNELPRMYFDEFETNTRQKIDEWMSPENVARRERAKARKVATEVILGK